MKIIQIVGFKNSGKTTIATKMIELLSKRGLRVASLKHHGHGGIPIGITETDSEKHKRAGALIAGVQGDGLLQLSTDTWDIEQMIAIYEFLKIEVLVIEGFKTYSFPKLVLINEEGDFTLLDQVDQVKAILTSIPLEGGDLSYPIFHRSEMTAVCDFLKL